MTWARHAMPNRSPPLPLSAATAPPVPFASGGAEFAVALGAGRRGEAMLEKQLLRRLFGEVQRRLHAGKQALFGEFDGPVQHQAPPPHDREVAAGRAEVDEEDIAHVAPGALACPGHDPRERRRSDIE